MSNFSPPKMFGASRFRVALASVFVLASSLFFLPERLFVDLGSFPDGFNYDESIQEVVEFNQKTEKTMKVFVYDLPPDLNTVFIRNASVCLIKMFAAEIYIHLNMLSHPVRTLDASEADWFFIPVYSTSDLFLFGYPINQLHLMSQGGASF